MLNYAFTFFFFEKSAECFRSMMCIIKKCSLIFFKLTMFMRRVLKLFTVNYCKHH